MRPRWSGARLFVSVNPDGRGQRVAVYDASGRRALGVVPIAAGKELRTLRYVRWMARRGWLKRRAA